MNIAKQRKSNRLMGYDYSQNGAYFITVCIQDRQTLLGEISVKSNPTHPEDTAVLIPSELGRLVIQETEKLMTIYSHITLDCYVIMPNHVHMIIAIDNVAYHEQMPYKTLVLPTVSRIIKQWKGVITKKAGFSPWQKSFHDHIIRNTRDYMHIREYIENNPAQWELDCFYKK
ncbi:MULTISPECIES: transposase [Acinetobacter]|uniref:Transposase IS200-like domain-containing protein n=1 Tax=Acinetobacter corruptisaponis TaxID=3045147 RepID=A0ABY8S6M4_9GAMM|nr:transposase [Acinetobacter sp. KCTC 92772]WHP07352.1 hypothetical protein QLH32_07845 [Acinetobacter sp. KCTC 92772]